MGMCGRRGNAWCSRVTTKAGTVLRLQGKGRTCVGLVRMIGTEEGGGHPGMLQRIGHIVVLIISVNTANHKANVANNKDDIF